VYIGVIESHNDPLSDQLSMRKDKGAGEITGTSVDAGKLEA